MTPQEVKKIIKERVYGVWEASHTSDGHRYRNTKTGHLLTSVTTRLGILSKPHLAKWQIKVAIEWLCVEDRWQRLGNEHWREEIMAGAMLAPFDIRDTAGGIGTVAHDAAERYINDWIASGIKPASIVAFAPEGCDPRSIASMRAVESFFNKHEIIPIASELLVGNIKYSAGTLDFLCFMDGKLTLIDFKTSNGVDQIGYSAQVAAYKFFFQLMTGIKIEQCKILWLSKDYDKFVVYKINNIGKAWIAFKQICSVFDWIYGTKDKIVSDIKRIKI